MGYAELIQRRLQELPLEKQAEIYDFVEFIVARSSRDCAVPASPDGWTDSEFSRMSLEDAMRGLEDDPVTYGLADIKERW